ncbi:transporter substrate-binding domain-containing protein [Aeromonas allosaccharophila]|uniref:substrate-binding periplasmic protein n=1 Tax=Aeromonas allosaccharophila TaxID=656 RepID=UPI001F3B1C71|nr:transporter substrate-binding domain-containing protein [Aeromonas allosaccharophila]MCE9849475.1 transporter substrate-binding domain-containing protein [Aeromonas allosaccharophila]
MLGLLLLLQSFSSLDKVDNNDIVFYSEQHLPLNGIGADGKPTGFAVETLFLIMKRMGYQEPKIHFLSWADSWYFATQRPNAVLFSTAKTKNRESLFKWACAITTSKISLLSNKDIYIESLKDLHKYKIGVIKADAGEQILLNYNVPTENLYQVSQGEQLIKQLLKNRTDMIAYNESVFNYVNKGVRYKVDGVKSIITLANIPTCFAFNKSVPIKFYKNFVSSFSYVQKTEEYLALKKEYGL